MNEWEYLVAVVRGALQRLSRGMAGAARGYKESAQMRPAEPDESPDGLTKEDLAEILDEESREDWHRMAGNPAYSSYAGNSFHYHQYDE